MVDHPDDRSPLQNCDDPQQPPPDHNLQHPRPMMKPLTLFALLTATVAWSPAMAQEPNDDCNSAIDISCGGSYQGSTIAALPDAVEGCVTGITAPGVWYRLVDTDAQVTLSVCNAFDYDTKINVYEGACDALVCNTGNDDACELGSAITFVANAGVDYFILVQGYNSLVGTFTLEVTCTEPTVDACEGAAPIACGETLSGTTVDATGDNVEGCGTDITAGGVWYTFTGTDAQVILTTCPDPGYDTKLNVYSGECGELVCVVGGDDTPGVGLCSTVAFDAVPGTIYRVLVQGYDGQTGTFDLNMSCLTCGAPTEIEVLPLDISATLSWSSLETGSTYTVEYGAEGFTPGTGTIITGVTGTDGPPVELTGLTISTSYDVYITLDCGNGDLSSTVGPVTFSTIDEALATNANCSGAIALACGGSVEGNTSLGLVAVAPTCGAANISTKGVWYTITGTGEVLTIGTCGATNFDSKVSVFAGTCDALVCVSGNDDAPGCSGNSSQVVFPSEAGVNYLVLVHGYNQSQGTFTLSATCTPGCTVAENDNCAQSTVLSIQPLGGCEASTGSNECAYASAVANPECDPFAPVVDVWYVFNSGFATSFSIVGEAVTAETVNIALYSDCSDPQYLACWTDVTAPINVSGLPENTDYLLRVWNGGGEEAGTFTLCVEADFNTAFGELEAEERIALWPVPAQDVLNVADVNGATLLRVLDMQGRILLEQGVNASGSTSLNVAKLAPGAYLLNNDQGALLGRFIKD